MFKGAKTFSQPLNNWNKSNVTNMAGMFLGAESFNQPIGNWNTSKVVNKHNQNIGFVNPNWKPEHWPKFNK
ncbi:BspA family leucine-rich repeat surface protein [Mycoplasma sp. 06067-C1-B144P-99-0482-3]|uniref:BspA family leucine-rich repeat surface protein n=1 Tax=Mycoplasma sp. 06067-C1-B144P-99-0482-3 TaxID=3117438 RepID=UPI003DA4DA49